MAFTLGVATVSEIVTVAADATRLDVTSPVKGNVIDTIAVSSNNMLDRTSQGVKLGATTVLSPRMLNEARAQWAYDDRFQTPQVSMPQITINDFGGPRQVQVGARFSF